VRIAEEIEARGNGNLIPATAAYDFFACFVDAGSSRFFWGLGCGAGSWADFRADREPPSVLCRSQRKLEELGARVEGTHILTVASFFSGGPVVDDALLAFIAGDVRRGTKGEDVPQSVSAYSSQLPDAAVLGSVAKLQADDVELPPTASQATTPPIALDLGAAPGGWAAALSRAHEFVFAVDPADVELAALSPRVVHVRSKAEDAIIRLRRAGLQSRISTITCDANVHANVAVEWILAAADLLREDGVAIFSAKNFSGGAAAWREDIAKIEGALIGVGLARVHKIHLFTGGEQEMTIFARR
jgi:hypothetical protein